MAKLNLGSDEERERNRSYAATYRRNHTAACVERKLRYKRRLRAHFSEVVSALMCEWCGAPAKKMNRTWNLRFHHRDPSEKSFSIGLVDHSWETILREMEKCDVVCAKCHYAAHKPLDEYRGVSHA